jgi:hypothetical protein
MAKRIPYHTCDLRFSGNRMTLLDGSNGGISIKVGNMEPSRYGQNDGSNAERALLPVPLFAEHGPNYGPVARSATTRGSEEKE